MRSPCSSPRGLLAPLALVLALASGAPLGCYDPVHADAVAQLGPEVNGIPEGPLHRAGQPCTTCHGGVGPGEPDFAFGGTIYAVKGRPEPSVSTTVTVTDAFGDKRVALTNEVGNFWVTTDQWKPQFPLKVLLEGDGVRREMGTLIGRDGGCGVCHRGGGDATFAPAVYLRDK